MLYELKVQLKMVGEERGKFWGFDQSVSMKLQIVSWNVRGINERNKRKIIKSLLHSHYVDLVCLQERRFNGCQSIW